MRDVRMGRTTALRSVGKLYTSIAPLCARHKYKTGSGIRSPFQANALLRIKDKGAQTRGRQTGLS
ncbi:MAG: hypothetical protein V7642_1819 [Burkholderiales bacterium]